MFLARLFKTPKISHPDAPGLYTYHQGTEFGNDFAAQKAVFNMSLQLPVLLARGAGRVYTGITSLQEPQVIYSGHAIPTSGFGGIQAGQIAFQPLETEYS